jgi:hypothetical protein
VKRKLLICIGIILSVTAFTQDTTKEQSSLLDFGGYAEVYYSYDFNKPVYNDRPFFLYNYNRHNEFNVNLAFIKGSYNTERARANIAVAVGTYMNANYAAEPGVFRNIYEASVGVKLSRNKNLWLDVGIFPSHIGFESAHAPSCWTLTRSIMAENSPYYESGARLTYTTNNGILSGLALNGWQRIQRVQGNSLMSWGTQLQFKPLEKVTLNYSTFLGTDTPDSSRLWRYLHDIYGIFQLTDKLGLIVGLDMGQQQTNRGSSEKNTWYGTSGILHYKLSNEWAIAVRGEYYSDENGVIISTGTPNGFKTGGASLNIDKSFGDNFLWRTELRTLSSKDAIFIKETNNRIKNNTAITTSLAATF